MERILWVWVVEGRVQSAYDNEEEARNEMEKYVAECNVGAEPNRTYRQINLNRWRMPTIWGMVETDIQPAIYK